jgi:uncharacterized repeat protein (TIGR03803 family)
MVNNSLCRGQDKRTIYESGVHIGNPGQISQASAFGQTVPNRNAILQVTSTTTDNIEQRQQQRGGNMIKLNWVTKACGFFLLWVTVAVALPAQTLTTLFTFNITDGQGPYPALVQGTDGNLYGTTELGGLNNKGTVFAITTSGMLGTLHPFDGTDGTNSHASMIQGTDGNFYGSTIWGGSKSCTEGCGTLFMITPTGTFSSLHMFDSTDGWEPGALVQGTDGNFYGTTALAGAHNDGTVYVITPSGTLTTLYNFSGTDGINPYGGLIQATDGNFYGSTAFGGANGDGTIFRITSGGTLTTGYNFHGMDGERPFGALLQAPDGSFYGTTYTGGANGFGTVFKLSGGVLTTLHSFNSTTDGDGPNAGLVLGTDGNFYGTTSEGGPNNDGTIFEITPGGTFTTLVTFDGTNGASPFGGLIQDTDGKFYGVASGLGNFSPGTVFSLSVGLRPFVKTQPSSGAVGAAVNILGTYLTGATSVTFNGTPAVFTLVSHSLITTTVPAGATSGKVQVVTTSGTLTGNLPFRVLP